MRNKTIRRHGSLPVPISPRPYTNNPVPVLVRSSPHTVVYRSNGFLDIVFQSCINMGNLYGKARDSLVDAAPAWLHRLALFSILSLSSAYDGIIHLAPLFQSLTKDVAVFIRHILSKFHASFA